MSEFVEVYAASDITLAYLVKAHLEDAGIHVQIANENISAAYCIDGMVPRVLVPAEQEQAAREVISEIQQGARDADDDLDDTDDLE